MRDVTPSQTHRLQLELQEKEGGREAVSEAIVAKNFPNLVGNTSPEIPETLQGLGLWGGAGREVKAGGWGCYEDKVERIFPPPPHFTHFVS